MNLAIETVTEEILSDYTCPDTRVVRALDVLPTFGSRTPTNDTSSALETESINPDFTSMNTVLEHTLDCLPCLGFPR